MLRDVDGGTALDVLVQPRASRAKLGPVHAGRLKVAVTAPPVDGEANAAVIALLAKQLGVARSGVEVIAGASSRRKTVKIAAPRAAIEKLLAALVVVLVLVLVGCQGTVGTVDVTLVTAPGSTVLDGVQSLRLVLTNPHQVETAERTSGGFAIDLQLPATSDTGALIVDGLDASGAIIATGASPPFPIGGVSANVAVYMAAPNSIAASPAVIDPPRTNVPFATVSYGAVFAGGTTADGIPSAATGVYNAFSHAIQVGVALPEARSGVALAVGTSGHLVYMFGGTDPTGTPRDTAYRFDTSVSPNGAISMLGEFDGFARTGQTALSIGDENILVTGAPIAVLSGSAGTVTARDELPSLPPSGAAVVGNDGVPAALFAGADGVTRFRGNTFDALSIPAAARADAIVVALPGGKLGVVCGGADAIVIDAASGIAQTLPCVPTEARTGCAAAATNRHLVIAGGMAGGTLATTAEIYDAATLALIATQPLVVPRTGAIATALPNGQILIAGGTDAAGAPIATLELFTPEATE